MNHQTEPQTDIGEIKFSLTPFEGCTTFRYKRKNVVTHEVWFDEVYGVTDVQGQYLINKWNQVAPGFWYYELVEEKEVV